MTFEQIHNAAHESFKLEFEQTLRARLMQEAQAQVEHIVHEYSKRLNVTASTHYDHRDMARIHTIRIKDTN